MRQQTSPAIVLRRTNYGEADRIVTFLTPIGKVRAIVKGVRRSKSKLAGGIELFSENTITFMTTRGNLARVISTRLNVFWEEIIGDLPRMMFGYEAMKYMDKVIEEEADRDYFELLKSTLAALAEVDILLGAIEIWFYLRLLDLQGHIPNLKTDNTGVALSSDTVYTFSVDDMCFVPAANGQYMPEHITLLRLCQHHQPQMLRQVQGIKEAAQLLQPLLKQMASFYLA